MIGGGRWQEGIPAGGGAGRRALVFGIIRMAGDQLGGVGLIFISDPKPIRPIFIVNSV